MSGEYALYLIRFSQQFHVKFLYLNFEPQSNSEIPD